MKLIAYILSIYILYLTIVPCIDKVTVVTGNHYELNNQKQNQQEKDQTDHCSPLCVCSCCSSIIELSHYFPHFEKFEIPSKINFSFSQQFISTFFSNIWQPPKIS